ncbi:ribonuclease Oy-like [Styela clava]
MRWIIFCGRMPLRTCMQTLLRVLFVLGFGGIFTIMQKNEVKWDYLVYTQIWPQSACIEINETIGDGKCVMPNNVKSWTIHGIWPNVHIGKNPSYCNDSWPFVPNDIKDIQPDLEIHWPNLILGDKVSAFWKHEWVKHGTCATSLPSLDSEHKYFQAGLNLRQKFDLSKMLAAAGIIPSLNTSIKLDRLRNVIKANTNSHTRLLCMETKTKTEQIIAQIEICLDKSFSPIDCDQSKYNLETPSTFQENPRFMRLKRSNTVWDPYPYFPNFMDCKDELPIKYLPIVPSLA